MRREKSKAACASRVGVYWSCRFFVFLGFIFYIYSCFSFSLFFCLYLKNHTMGTNKCCSF